MRSETVTLHEKAKHSKKNLQDYIFLIMWEVKTALYYAIINNQNKGSGLQMLPQMKEAMSS